MAEKNKSNVKDDLFRKTSFDLLRDKYTRHKKRIFLALKDTEQGKEMKICDDGGSLCGSIFCERCGKKKQDGMFYSYKKRFESDLGGDEVLARKRLRWVSVLHNVVPIKVDTIQEEQETISKVGISVEQMKGYISLLGKEADRMCDGASGLWMRGGIHIEIIDYASYKEAARTHKVRTNKEDTLSSFVDETAFIKSNFMFLIHFHGLFDMGNMKEKDFRSLFIKRWGRVARQTHKTKLWEQISVIKRDINGKVMRNDKGKMIRERKKQDIKHALRGMANYCFSWSNINLEYKQNWGSGRYKSLGTYVVEVESIENIKRLTEGHIRLLVQAHSLVNGISHRGLIVSIY